MLKDWIFTIFFKKLEVSLVMFQYRGFLCVSVGLNVENYFVTLSNDYYFFIWFLFSEWILLLSFDCIQ